MAFSTSPLSAASTQCTLPEPREHEVIINAFLAPQILLMSVPVIGPIVFVPIQGAAAWLVDMLAKESANQPQPMQPAQGLGNSYKHNALHNSEVHPSNQSRMGQQRKAPTMPASPPVFSQSGNEWPVHFQ